MPHPLTIHLTDDAAAMWAHVKTTWAADPTSALLVANDAAAARILADCGQAIADTRLLTMGGVIEEVRTRAGLPRVGPEVQMLVAIREALADAENPLVIPSQLRRHAQSSSTIAALADHIGELDERAPDDYAPDGDVEEAIWRLRAHLIETGAAAGTLRSAVSRAARLYHAGCRLIVPLTRLSRYHGMLLEGLAEHAPVECHLLSAPAVATSALGQIFTPGSFDVVEAYTGRGDGIFSPMHRPAPGLGARIVDDEIDAALAALAGWLEEGCAPHELALVSTAPAEQLEQAADAWGIPLLLWRNIGARDTALGATLAQIARADLTRPSSRQLLRERSSWALADEDLAAIQRARDDGPVAELAQLVQWGDGAIAGCDVTQPAHSRALQWLDALARTHDALAEHRVPLDGLDEVFERTVVPPRQWGSREGVAVLGWGELGAGAFRRVVYTGLSDYPPPGRAHPFLTGTTRRRWPELADRDRRPELAAALALYDEQALALREGRDGSGGERAGGIFWAEIERHAAPVAAAGSESHRRALRRFARLRQAAHPEIVRAAERALAEGRPARLAAGRAAYAVTELELYLRCPYGWFVRHVLNPTRGEASPAARKGQVAHAALERLLLHPADALRAVVDLGSDLPPLEQQILAHQIERTLARYAGEAWPFSRHRAEVELRSGALLPGRIVQGRADRIDDDGESLLVIDYKLRRAPALRRAEQRASELQRYLYPLLAAEASDQTPLGTLLVSLFHADHEGSVNAAREELIGPAVDLDFDDDAASACRIAAEAIERIEMGQWDEIGQACPAWCEHHLASPIFPAVRGGA